MSKNIFLTKRKGLKENDLKQKKPKKHLTVLQKELRRILDSIPTTVYIKDRENRYVWVNKTFAKLLELPRSQLMGKSCFDIFPEKQADAIWKEDLEVIKSGQPKTGIIESFRNNQGTFWFQIDKIPHRDEKGNIIGVVGCDTDITERQKTEMELARVASFPQRNPNPITEVDFSGKTFYLNPAALRLLPDLEQKGIAHPWLANWQSVCRSFYKSKRETMIRDVAVDKRFYQQTLYYEAENKRIRIYAQDITELKLLQQRKDEFISVASHELRTPITTIKAYTQILGKYFSLSDDPKPAEYLSKLDFQVSRLTDLINQLLDVSKIQYGKLDLIKEKFNLTDLVEEIAKDMQQIGEKYSIIVEGNSPKPIFADRHRISQVLINLISNAMKYSPKADKIIIKIISNKTNVEVKIQDFGIGIRSSDLTHLFERFFQAENRIRISSGGLGLGLYICRQIINEHGGKIWAESEKGEGSTFTFTLPYGE